MMMMMSQRRRQPRHVFGRSLFYVVCIVVVVVFVATTNAQTNDEEDWPVKMMAGKVADMRGVFRTLGNIGEFIGAQTICGLCAAVVGILMHSIKHGGSEKDLRNVISFFCRTLQIQSNDVCDGYADQFSPHIVYVSNATSAQPKEVCSVLLFDDTCGHDFAYKNEWNVTMTTIPKPQVSAIRISNNMRPMKVLHLADTHIDEDYVEGSNAVCKDSMCCRATSGTPSSEENKAGRWGDYRDCDLPPRTMHHMLAHIKTTHPDIDYVIWTGDSTAHDNWDSIKEKTLGFIKRDMQMLFDTFPGVPIFPAVGNHDISTINNFPYKSTDPRFSVEWLYNELDTQWRRWLPVNTSETIKRGAYYSVLVKPKFRIITINSNYCYNMNWWLMVDSVDPTDELSWLVNELQMAEINGEKVHIVGHVPPGNMDCLKVWSRNFNEIVNRYENTVRASFSGHTHFDEFQVLYDLKEITRPICISYIAPSATSFSYLNPAYRIYYVDGDETSDRMVIDHETWTMNLTEANISLEPKWYKLYTAKGSFQLPDLTPREWDRFIMRMAANKSIFEQYHTYYYRNSTMMPACNAKCRKRLTCDARSGRAHDRDAQCSTIWEMIETDLKREEMANIIRDVKKGNIFGR